MSDAAHLEGFAAIARHETNLMQQTQDFILTQLATQVNKRIDSRLFVGAMLPRPANQEVKEL